MSLESGSKRHENCHDSDFFFLIFKTEMRVLRNADAGAYVLTHAALVLNTVFCMKDE